MIQLSKLITNIPSLLDRNLFLFVPSACDEMLVYMYTPL